MYTDQYLNYINVHLKIYIIIKVMTRPERRGAFQCAVLQFKLFWIVLKLSPSLSSLSLSLSLHSQGARKSGDQGRFPFSSYMNLSSVSENEIKRFILLLQTPVCLVSEPYYQNTLEKGQILAKWY